MQAHACRAESSSKQLLSAIVPLHMPDLTILPMLSHSVVQLLQVESSVTKAEPLLQLPHESPSSVPFAAVWFVAFVPLLSGWDGGL